MPGEITTQLVEGLAKTSAQLESVKDSIELLRAQQSDANGHLAKKIEGISRLLTGSGDDSIVTQHALMKELIKQHDHKFQRIENWITWATRGAVTALLTFVVYFVKHIVKP